MGLDIIACSRISKADVELDETGHPVASQYWETMCRAWVNPDWPERAQGLEHNAWYTFERQVTFRAGAYSAYNEWREQLAKMAGYPAEETYSRSFGNRTLHSAACWNGKTGPFSLLIDFSDCEGAMSQDVCRQLLADFVEFDDKAREIGGWFYEKYSNWKEALEVASDGGMVCFH
jgi:hypothetical protein